MKYFTILTVCFLFGANAFAQDIHRAFFTLAEKGQKIEMTVRMNKSQMETAMEGEKTCTGGVEFEWCSVAYVQTHMEFTLDGNLAEMNYISGKEDGEDYVIIFHSNELFSKPQSIDLKANCFQNTQGNSPESASVDFENVVEFNLFGVNEKHTLNAQKGAAAQQF